MDSSTVAAITIAPPTISATTLLIQVASGALDPTMAVLIFLFDKAPFFAIFAFTVIFFYNRVAKPMGERVARLFVKIEKLTDSLENYTNTQRETLNSLDKSARDIRGICGKRNTDKLGEHRE